MMNDELWTLDFEASGITKDYSGYPIEVGYTNGTVEREFLIKPYSHWTNWDWYAEKYVHKISRDTLRNEGFHPKLVCEWMNKDLAGKTVYCNGGKHDKGWLRVLFEDSNVKPLFKLESYTVLNYYREDEEIPHRALADAKLFWQDIMNERKIRGV